MDPAEQGTRPEQVFRLIYRSRSVIESTDRKVALGQIFSRARSGNKAKHITGALLVSGDWFAQVLAGDEAQVRELFGKISGDKRHDHLRLLAADGEADIPLIAHVDGIVPAAGHCVTPEQESVLSDLREATKAARTQF